MRKKRTSLSRLNHKNPNHWLFLILAFLIPFLGFLTVMLLYGCEPFGNDKAFLYSDEYHQYYPFFVNFHNALRSGDSLLYNWQIGMGVDYLGLVAYYLGSPLNLLSVLVPESLLLEYFAILPAVRLGFAGLFFAIMLHKLYGKNDFSLPLFGALYALCGWALAYQWNVMWLDTFALLPLVMLGTIRLLRDKKVVLYTVSLFFSIVCNYYIGLFTCIFVLLVSLCYEICHCSSFKRLLQDFVRIALFSALAIGMTAFLELPALMALGTTQSSVNNFPQNFSMNILDSKVYSDARQAWMVFREASWEEVGLWVQVKNWFTAMGQSFLPILKGMKEIVGNMAGGIKPTFKEGLPNVYSGCCTLVMASLFLTSEKIKLREKICSVFLLLFFMLSCLLRQLDYIWHGFHFTNMIPYRFTFLFSFVMIWMAYRAWLLRESFQSWQLVCAVGLSLCIIILHEDFSSEIFLFTNAIMMVLTIALFAFILIRRSQLNKLSEALSKKEYKRLDKRYHSWVSWLLVLVIGAEVVLNLFNFGMHFTSTTIKNYPKGTENTASAISYMKYRERNNLFYRAEVTHTQTFNDAPLNNYNGITAFTSSANVDVTNFMRSLGYGAKATYNRYAFEESAPIGNLFLNLKYMIERDGDLEDNSYFDNVHHFGDVYLLENNHYLPLGFLAQPELEDWVFNSGRYSFQRQNKLFQAATGIEQEVWEMSPSGCLTITSRNVELESMNEQTGRTTYKATDNGTITYCYFVPKSGLLCMEIDAPKKNNIRLYKEINNVRTELYSESMSLPQMLSVAEVKAGEYVWLEVDCKADETATLDVQAGVLNKDVFQQGYDILAASTLDLTHFSNTRVEGTIQCNRDGLLYTSIPNNGNWLAQVDGEDAELVTVGECMVAVRLTEGQHTVTFRYKNQAFTMGLLISVGCAIVFVGLVLLSRLLLKKRQEKQGSTTPEEAEEILPEDSTSEAEEPAPDPFPWDQIEALTADAESAPTKEITEE